MAGTAFMSHSSYTFPFAGVTWPSYQYSYTFDETKDNSIGVRFPEHSEPAGQRPFGNTNEPVSVNWLIEPQFAVEPNIKTYYSAGVRMRYDTNFRGANRIANYYSGGTSIFTSFTFTHFCCGLPPNDERTSFNAVSPASLVQSVGYDFPPSQTFDGADYPAASRNWGSGLVGPTYSEAPYFGRSVMNGSDLEMERLYSFDGISVVMRLTITKLLGIDKHGNESPMAPYWFSSIQF